MSTYRLLDRPARPDAKSEEWTPVQPPRTVRHAGSFDLQAALAFADDDDQLSEDIAADMLNRWDD